VSWLPEVAPLLTPICPLRSHYEKNEDALKHISQWLSPGENTPAASPGENTPAASPGENTPPASGHSSSMCSDSSQKDVFELASETLSPTVSNAILRLRFFPGRGDVMRVWIICAVVCCIVGCASSHRPSYKGAKRISINDIDFDDGDTFFLKTKPVRVLGVDTPEIAHPSVGFHEDQPYGPVAAESTRVWFARAEIIEWLPAGKDRYGRRLAHVFLDGNLLAILLIQHSLGYETVTQFGDNGYPDLAQQILEVSRTAPKPKFKPPYQWRKKNRKRKTN
jgi:endonuclease YncB( thermonuclease family)